MRPFPWLPSTMKPFFNYTYTYKKPFLDNTYTRNLSLTILIRNLSLTILVQATFLWQCLYKKPFLNNAYTKNRSQTMLIHEILPWLYLYMKYFLDYTLFMKPFLACMFIYETFSWFYLKTILCIKTFLTLCYL